MSILQPSLRRFGSIDSLAVSLEEAREWVGLYDDDSEDDVIESLISAGEMKLRQLANGRPLSPVQVSDFFCGFASVLELGSQPTASSTIVVTYFSELTDAPVTYPEADYIVDRTGERARIVSKALVPRTSRYYNNPVWVEYTTGEGKEGEAGEDELKQALRRYVWVHYYTRDPQELKEIDVDGILLKMLSNYNIGIA